MTAPLDGSVNSKNIHALHEVAKKHDKLITILVEKVTRIEAELTNTKAELLNAKQLVAHLNGRGMGPTV